MSKSRGVDQTREGPDVADGEEKHFDANDEFSESATDDIGGVVIERRNDAKLDQNGKGDALPPGEEHNLEIGRVNINFHFSTTEV